MASEGGSGIDVAVFWISCKIAEKKRRGDTKCVKLALPMTGHGWRHVGNEINAEVEVYTLEM